MPFFYSPDTRILKSLLVPCNFSEFLRKAMWCFPVYSTGIDAGKWPHLSQSGSPSPAAQGEVPDVLLSWVRPAC